MKFEVRNEDVEAQNEEIAQLRAQLREMKEQA